MFSEVSLFYYGQQPKRIEQQHLDLQPSPQALQPHRQRITVVAGLAGQ